MKYILITILLTLSIFLFAGGTFTSGETQHYKQTDSYYDNKGRNIQDNSFSSQYTPYTEQVDDHYGEKEVFTQDSSFTSQYTPYTEQVDGHYEEKEVFTQDSSFTSQYIPYNEQVDDHYGEKEVFTQDSSFISQYTQGAITEDICETCGEPANLLPYNGENIPMARLFPCPAIQGCINQGNRIY